ncbi:hypothetical protein ACIBK9_19915 [Nonomuraea sp. NPDC050227]|uniref:hypothetical protein n=1 Tax=Nonomuraea sp. NPDC050227 TaxID=3364360 RepID=UPI0037A88CEB
MRRRPRTPGTTGRRARRGLCAAAAALLVAATSTTPAHAADNGSHHEDWVYRSDSLCLLVYAEMLDLSDRNAGSYQTSAANVYGPNGGIPCGRGWAVPAGHLAIRQVVLVYDLTHQVWGACPGLDSGLHYTPDTTSHADWYMWSGEGSNPAPCGTAWYATLAFGYVWDGAWNGGSLPSGNVWITARYGLQAKTPPAQPPRPSWITGTGAVDPSRLPDRLPLIGADGEPQRTGSGDVATVDTATLFGPPSQPPPG